MNNQRPLSPHLQVYRWQWTMFFSIMHRLTSLVITAGFVFLCLRLIAYGFIGNITNDIFLYITSNVIFKLIAFFFAWSLILHFFLGVRHLIFDAVKFLDLGHARLFGYIAFISATLVWLAHLPIIGNGMIW